MEIFLDEDIGSEGITAKDFAEQPAEYKVLSVKRSAFRWRFPAKSAHACRGLTPRRRRPDRSMPPAVSSARVAAPPIFFSHRVSSKIRFETITPVSLFSGYNDTTKTIRPPLHCFGAGAGGLPDAPAIGGKRRRPGSRRRRREGLQPAHELARQMRREGVEIESVRLHLLVANAADPRYPRLLAELGGARPDINEAHAWLAILAERRAKREPQSSAYSDRQLAEIEKHPDYDSRKAKSAETAIREEMKRARAAASKP